MASLAESIRARILADKLLKEFEAEEFADEKAICDVVSLMTGMNTDHAVGTFWRLYRFLKSLKP